MVRYRKEGAKLYIYMMKIGWRQRAMLQILPTMPSE